MKKITLPVFLIVLLFSCTSEKSEPLDYELLPEGLVATRADYGLEASYVLPVLYYPHGILGDAIEAAGLQVMVNDDQLTFFLDSTQVFEDLVPRLVDVNGDDYPEVICILSHVDLGGSVAVFEIDGGELKLLSQSAYIGRSNRWLNLAAISDLNRDGKIELAWVETPHIGGTLKVGHVVGDEILVSDSQTGVTNHKIRTRNLDLSLIKEFNGISTLYLPGNAYDKLIGFQFNGNEIIPVDTVVMNVDPLIPLSEQIHW